jgi:muconolactone delta-isomerase
MDPFDLHIRSAAMKFLVCTWPSADVPKHLPSVETFESQTEWFRSRLSEGVIDCAHHAHNRAIFIFNAESREALDALMGELPLNEHTDHSVEPLMDFWAHSETVAGVLRKAAAKRAEASAR